mmetsp:Transcript_28714/g.86201  ORF Transcript_28714/g.86201 Transcript_28714/m.86201 type:complete len:133 (+) Transcript_28714:1838-2236(+)
MHHYALLFSGPIDFRKHHISSGMLRAFFDAMRLASRALRTPMAAFGSHGSLTPVARCAATTKCLWRDLRRIVLTTTATKTNAAHTLGAVFCVDSGSGAAARPPDAATMESIELRRLTCRTSASSIVRTTSMA